MVDVLVPDPPLDLAEAVGALRAVLGERRRWVLLTGAGISTESGIPDYRGPETARRARNPMRFQTFIGDAHARARYWARATVGWGRIDGARPNLAHRAAASLEQDARLAGIITQNVDGLHHKAGAKNVIELHGSLHDVRCLACHRVEPRSSLQARLARVNAGWDGGAAAIAPDGDAEIDPAMEASFRVVGCRACGGDLKPDVVFFGESVPRKRVESAYAWVDQADALLVVGTSLTVFSGYRFVKRAHTRGLPIAIVNVGPTRGDPLATLKIEGRAGSVLPALAQGVRP